MKDNIAAIILAAGRGKRMESTDKNKVVFPLKGKPMIAYTIRLLNELDISEIIVVVGFAKESVYEVLGTSVQYAEQKEQRGTADAVWEGLKKVSDSVSHILVLNGDDSAFYTKEVVQALITKHIHSSDVITLLTTKRENPYGIGRIVRTKNKKLVKIVEEKDASEEEKMITEVNVGCYLFTSSYLKRALPKLEKSSITGEYYLTTLVDMALQEKLPVETVTDPNLRWHGINTKEDLQKAETYFM